MLQCQEFKENRFLDNIRKTIHYITIKEITSPYIHLIIYNPMFFVYKMISLRRKNSRMFEKLSFFWCSRYGFKKKNSFEICGMIITHFKLVSVFKIWLQIKSRILTVFFYLDLKYWPSTIFVDILISNQLYMGN